MISQLLGFVFAGGVATVLNFIVFLALLEINVNVSLAAAVGYVSGILVSFTINKLWIFREAKNPSVMRYFIAYAIALFGQLVLLNLLLFFGLPPEVSNALAIAVIVVLNYFLVRKFVFRT